MLDTIELIPFDISREITSTLLTDIWNAACGAEFEITPRFVVFNLLPVQGVTLEGRIATIKGKPVGFILVGAEIKPSTAESKPVYGWIDAIAVLPEYRNKGVGSTLMQWAEYWLSGHDVVTVTLGGSLKPFFPGLPEELGSEKFFIKRGFVSNLVSSCVYDMSRDLADGKAIIRRPNPEGGEILPLQSGQVQVVEEFLKREFPGGWLTMYQEFIRMKGRLSDILVLWVKGQAEGFCWVAFEDSYQPLDRFYMHRLPKPWGQLGPIGVSQAVRGLGWGGAILQAGLEKLRSGGVRGCVIDWLVLVDFYGKYGFNVYHTYRLLMKNLS